MPQAIYIQQQYYVQGGIWFDNNMAGKETIENVQAVQLGARLARIHKVKRPQKMYRQYNLKQGWPGYTR